MKIAVINFSGNVGKTTISKHLLMPRICGAELISIESLNAGDAQGPALRGRQFGELQEYLQTVDSAVVDIGASNVEDLLALMQRYRGSQEDFDYFIVPTVPPVKQQQDTIATLVELSRLGVSAQRLKLVFNMVEVSASISPAFNFVLAFLAEQPIATADLACQIGQNEIYARLTKADADLPTLAADNTDYKALIANAKESAAKLALAQKLATRRLASGVVPELDACFAALCLGAPNAQPRRR
ncbi:StbB family protein [Roseateles sp. P5_D6]